MESDKLLYSGLLVLAAGLLHLLSRLAVKRLQRGESILPAALDRWFKPAESGRYGELLWIHLCVMLCIWVAVGLTILYWLGWQDASSALLRRLVDAGFDLAGIHIVPARIVMGLLVGATLIGAARQLRTQLGQVWLAKSKWDTSARESVATLAGYAAMVVAVLVGLGVAGFNLTNLAIVAGALSVGIGFGLQNIVNNFISGLILLSERPVRRGDYVRVGSVEGEVRQIHIRATEIETLDRVSVIVPNSELIASAVHNWRLRDPYIRVVISVGVAYGSDTEKVRRLLTEIGVAHPLTLPNGTPGVPDTHVYFVGFGDSSLNFELRTFIRDVNKRGSVASDLRFAIDAAFREHGIVIPFPQRDVWMKSDASQPTG